MKNLPESIFACKELYQRAMEPVCEKYSLSHTEIIIMLFLSDMPEGNTAKDIVDRYGLTKSSVSVAARVLQEKGYISGGFTHGNHRSIHLRLCPEAEPVVEAAKKARQEFLSAVTSGFTDEEKEQFRAAFIKVRENISEMKKESK